MQAVLLDSASRVAQPESAPSVFSAVADARGSYRITGMPSGRFAIGFQHDALDALGLESPVRIVDLAADTSVRADLAIPSGQVVRAARCAGDSSDGMLAGFILQAQRGSMRSGATVTALWVEVVLRAGKFRTEPQHVTATVNDEGRYLAYGSVLASGRVTIPALELEVPIVNGTFTVTGIPAGTWELEALAIGYEPHAMLVDAVEGAPASVPLTLTHKAQTLDAINVVGTPSGDLKVLRDVMDRRRFLAGTVFLPGNPTLQSALYPADVLTVARGFWSGRARGCTHVGPTGKRLIVYIDGVRFPGGLEQLNSMVTIREVLAIEVYPDIISLPYLWRTSDACAVIAVWTKR